MATTLGIFNRKGGSGKTHSCINIAGCLAMKGYKVLVVDGDPLNSISTLFFSKNERVYTYGNCGWAPRPDITTVYEILENDENIYDAIYSTKEYSIKRKADGKFERYKFTINILLGTKKMDYVKVDRIDYFSRHLVGISSAYDFILVDFPPVFSNLTNSYMYACDHILVPAVLGDIWSLHGYLNVARQIENLHTDYGDGPDILGLYYTQAQLYRPDQKKQYDNTIQGTLSDILFRTYISFDYAANRISSDKGEPLVVCAPGSACTKNYMGLTDEILSRLGAN